MNITSQLLSGRNNTHLLCRDAAVQEERQRNREREGELEFSVGVNDEMPVEKILEAETAVEQKTELHSDGGSAGSSVSLLAFLSGSQCSIQSPRMCLLPKLHLFFAHSLTMQ